MPSPFISRFCCNPGPYNPAAAFGLLLLRLGAGGLLAFGHGWGKLANFSEYSSTFPDPLGIGSAWSLCLMVFAEFFCGLAVVLGLGTRLAAIPPVIAMFVAVTKVHASDPFFMPMPPAASKEFAVLYLIPFLALIFLGAGKFSADAAISKGCCQGGGPKPPA